MKFTVKKSNLFPALQSLLPVVEKTHTLMILSHVLIDVGDGKITMTATDMESQIVVSFPADTQEQGRFTVPARKLFDVIKNVGDAESIKISVGDSRASINTPTGKYQLAVLSAGDFPVLDEVKGVVAEFSVSQAEFKQSLGWVKAAMGNQDVRYYLNGTLLTSVNDRLVFVSTDGHRLSKVETGNVVFSVDPPNDWRGAIIPRKSALSIQSMLSDKPDDSAVNVIISSNLVSLSFDGISFTSKLIDGKFPDYVRAIPADNNKKGLVNRKAWIKAVQNTSALIEKDKGIELLFESGNLVMSTRNPEQETGSETISIEYGDASVHIAFGYVYVLDALNALPGDDVKAFLSDGGTGIVLRPADDDVDVLHVISPMRM